MIGQLDEALAPQPIHNLAEHDKYEEIDDFQEEHHKADEHDDKIVDGSGVHGRSRCKHNLTKCT